jgi:Domain of unknown function (DUF6894)
LRSTNSVYAAGRLTALRNLCRPADIQENAIGGGVLTFMPRYFVDLTDDDSLSLAGDEIGENSNEWRQREGHAMAVARELSRHRPPNTIIGLHISVIDERGVVVFKVPL